MILNLNRPIKEKQRNTEHGMTSKSEKAHCCGKALFFGWSFMMARYFDAGDRSPLTRQSFV